MMDLSSLGNTPAGGAPPQISLKNVASPLVKTHEIRLPAPGCNRLALSGDGRVIASAGWDCKVGPVGGR